ncbi:Pilin accessory protein (PilO) [Yersinia ruckeri]|uniref:Pilin accessory protein (PilO) n=1 Tax=Yersinia ruckeri TaxID=29486 RepID=A0A380SAA7_YERRU|nr:type 4b pilus protein PilO2 [Yersinia ruckeri]SUQ37506.1 Pilin accessory protein (PilO) [Yersinia ruckeri]
MTRQTTPGRYSVQVGKVWLIAGLYWQYLPLRGRRSMRLRARAAKASHWAALPTEEGQAQGTLLGTVNINDITGHKRGRLQQASMALAVLPTLPADCYAVFLLPNGQYWFVAINNGMLSPFGDIVGSETAVRTAVDNFLQITAVPDGGWTVYAPAGFFPDTAIQARELIPQLSNTSGLRRARLYKTHDTQAMWFWGGPWWHCWEGISGIQSGRPI